MSTVWRKYLDAVSEVSVMTRDRAEAIVRQVLGESSDGRPNVQGLVDDLMKRQARNRDAVVSLVRTETTRAIRAMGLATSVEVERLQSQVADLKREVARLRDEGRPSQPPVAGERTRTAAATAATSAAKPAKPAKAAPKATTSAAKPSATPGGRPVKRPTRPAVKGDA
jgi:polyhydroxyalkanoate synthesis regulator phasin